MAVTAIPTEYNGVRFRSRLEAKWAAFFDRCNWRWVYEPNDFDGYIPDAQTDEVSPWGFAFGFTCQHCGEKSFAAEDESWHCRVRGCYDERNGRHHLGEWDIDEDFRRACSEVQWRPR